MNIRVRRILDGSRKPFFKLVSTFALVAASFIPADLYGAISPSLAQSSHAETCFTGTSTSQSTPSPQFDEFDQLPKSWRRLLESSEHVAGHAGLAGKDLYDSLDSPVRAALLNIIAKADATILPDGTTVLGHLKEILVLNRDRFFASADADLKADIDASLVANTFFRRNCISSTLHHAEPGFQKRGSYKTHDSRGNLDITLSARGHDWRAEIDIDEREGIAHFFSEVAWHYLSSTVTDPYRVEPLLEKQRINPHFRLATDRSWSDCAKAGVTPPERERSPS